MRISVILELEEVGAGAAAGAAGGWFNIVITTGDGVLLWQKRMRGKLDLLLRTWECCSSIPTDLSLLQYEVAALSFPWYICHP